MMLLNMMSAMVQAMVQTMAQSAAAAKPSAPATKAPAAKPAAAGTPGNAGNAGAAATPSPQPAQRAPGKAKVAVIDDFNSNQNGFQHGTEVSNAASSAAGGAEIQRLPGTGSANIASSLRQVLNNARSGNKVDVVNISQFVTGNQQEIQGLIQQLRQEGIPVVVAAGNNGPNQRNGIGGGSALTATNGTNQSGPGNVRGNGRTTSFAAADISGKLAQLIASGTPVEQAIRQMGVS
jgi:methylmalonyl-CoA mutase cobalamin-binding subunit